MDHLGKNFRISGLSFPHIDGVLYSLDGIDGEVWEECLIDRSIKIGDSFYGLASDFYKVAIEECDGERFVVIRGQSRKAPL